MQKELTEQEFIEMIGENNYKSFAMNIYELIKKTEAYKDLDDAVFYIGAEPLDETTWFHFEATIKKLPFGDDFGFTRMVITDDFDFVLDRVNDAKRVLNLKQVI
jgi:hypothetical protein